MSYTCGEKPGKGIYICKNCGNDVRLDDNTDTLPPFKHNKNTLGRVLVFKKVKKPQN